MIRHIEFLGGIVRSNHNWLYWQKIMDGNYSNLRGFQANRSEPNSHPYRWRRLFDTPRTDRYQPLLVETTILTTTGPWQHYQQRPTSMPIPSSSSDETSDEEFFARWAPLAYNPDPSSQSNWFRSAPRRTSTNVFREFRRPVINPTCLTARERLSHRASSHFTPSVGRYQSSLPFPRSSFTTLRAIEGPPAVPAISFGKRSFDPIANLDNIPQGLPAKPGVAGFSRCHEKAKAARDIQSLIGPSGADAQWSLGNLFNSDVLNRFWSETNGATGTNEERGANDNGGNTTTGIQTDVGDSPRYSRWNEETSGTDSLLRFELFSSTGLGRGNAATAGTSGGRRGWSTPSSGSSTPPPLDDLLSEDDLPSNEAVMEMFTMSSTETPEVTGAGPSGHHDQQDGLPNSFLRSLHRRASSSSNSEEMDSEFFTDDDDNDDSGEFLSDISSEDEDEGSEEPSVFGLIPTADVTLSALTHIEPSDLFDDEVTNSFYADGPSVLDTFSFSTSIPSMLLQELEDNPAELFFCNSDS